MSTEESQKDLQQEIIIQLWKSYQSFRGESEFSTWMYRVSINTAITFFKKEKKQNETFLYQDIPDKPALEYDGKLDRKMELFYQAVHQLKPVEKAIIFYLLEGLSHKEIGQNLGISEGNARVKLNRTKEKLQNILKNKVYEF
jgi:RNA polymerase sigma-70 factor (ECF subfamily)